MIVNSIFHRDFHEFPYWREARARNQFERTDLPAKTDIVIIGAGYAGLSAALRLKELEVEAIVIDKEEPGFGASTRSGGLVGGSIEVKKSVLGTRLCKERFNRMSIGASDAFNYLEQLLVREKISCGWQKTGRFIGAWSDKHYQELQCKCQELNQGVNTEAYTVPPAAGCP